MSGGFESGPYRIECKECGAEAWGDGTAMDPEFDAEWHRDHYCPGAEFEVEGR